ncbi:MAG: hypothetical protein JXB39_07345 [Deltaproteobacteria bacterium]|nr:hypothetical protein [Deltaproteobacteria bacterium]
MNRRAHRFLGVLLVVLVPVLGAAGTPQERFDEGTAAYQAGDAVGAEQAFREVIAGGTEDGHAWYNLGNAWYRLGRPGLAIHAWRRAEVYLPRDPDVRANLDRARLEVKDRLEAPILVPAHFFWQRPLAPGESARLAAVLAALALVLANLLVARRRAGQRGWSWAGVGALGLAAALLGLSTVALQRSLAQGAVAVVLAPEVTARSTVGGEGVDLFVLHEGAEVAVRAREPGHVLVTLPDGRWGWLPRAAVATLDPAEGPPGA